MLARLGAYLQLPTRARGISRSTSFMAGLSPDLKKPGRLAIPEALSHLSEPLLDPASLAAWKEAAKAPTPSSFQVCSYNVWMSSSRQIVRHRNLIAELITRRPAVVLLQEVKPWLADGIRACPLQQLYIISPFNYGYGNLTLVRRDLTPSNSALEPSQVVFEDLPLTTIHGRSLLLTTVTGLSGLNDLVFANMHFESLASEKIRAIQLQEVRDALPSPPSSHSLVLVGGDYNFDDLQTWGDWQKTARFPDDDQETPLPPPAPLENANIERIMHPTYADAWLHLAKDDAASDPNTTPRDADRRYTFDGKLNQNVKDSRETMRYDRFLVSRHAGLSSLEDVEILRPPDVSDHFGLLASFQNL
jgi:endonuclease/exonuclease/phosphatase family metal-dependent hydrolase